MKQRWLVNLILLLLLLILAALMRGELTKSREIPKLMDLAAGDLYRIEIARQGEPTIELTRGPLGWRMEAPMRVDADAGQVEQLLAILDTPVHRSFPQESAELARIGLAPTKLKLRLDARELGFGGLDPLGGYRYVSAEGLVHLIDDRFYHLLIAPPIEHVARDLLPRGFEPVFGRLGAVPLAAETLAHLSSIRAERVETLVEAPGATPVELKAADGTTLGFEVSEDGRRWARRDQNLLYVLTDAPEIIEDPGAIDPTPPAPPLAMPLDAPASLAPQVETPPANLEDPFAPPAQTGEEPAPPPDPDSLVVPSDAALDAVPVVRLTPNGEEEPRGVKPRKGATRQPEEPAAYGFGQDPFAPDPAMYPAQNPPGGDR